MTRKKTHKQNFGTHPVPGQSRKFVYVYVLFLSLKGVEGGGASKRHLGPDPHLGALDLLPREVISKKWALDLLPREVISKKVASRDA